MARSCGNEECSVSTGLGDELTFGSGELSFNGYWEHPCRICEQAYELKEAVRLLKLLTRCYRPGKTTCLTPDHNEVLAFLARQDTRKP